jgi:tetratricopeptide (TPR) repeat protein
MRSWNSKRDAPTSATLLTFVAVLITASAAAQDSDISPVPTFGSNPDAVEAGDGLAALRRARETLMRINDFEAALSPAKTTVERQERAPMPDASYPRDLAALARIQAEIGEIETAEANFLKAINLIQAAEGEYSITLVEPYRGLGRSYIKAMRYPEAIAALESAQHVSQRNLGLFNVEQAPLLDDITTAYLGIGDTTEARKMQLERLDNAVKRYGADDPRVYPFRYQLADYYQRSRMTVSAREQYEAVLKSQETQAGAADPALLSPLRQLVKIDLMMTQGEEDEAYTRLVSILDQSSDVDAVERGLSLATLGDWATVKGDALGARAYYQQAWATLSGSADLDVASLFAKPVMLDFIAPLSSVDRGQRSKPYSWAGITFAFDVSAEGRPFNVRAIGREGPPAPIESRYSRRLRETHFRPRLVAGEPVATDNVQFTHYFRFYVDDEKKEKDGEG